MKEGKSINEQLDASAKTHLRNLLLKCVLMDNENFLHAFGEWEKQVIYDDLDFQSFKLLSIIYPKLLKYNVESPLRTRIKSFYRRTWTENQLLLTELKALFTALNSEQINFIIADETIRLTQIYNDTGIYSLQNFSINVPFSSKKEFCQKLSDKLWRVKHEEFERTVCCKDKALSIQILWASEAEFAAQIKNVELISVKNSLQPILNREEQILNLCARDFKIYGDQDSRWQLIASKLIKSKNLDQYKLINSARERYLAFRLSEMLQKLNDAYDLKISGNLMAELKKIKKAGKLIVFKRKIKNLRQSYQTYLKYENEAEAKNSFFKFLAKRWNSDSNAVFIRRLVQSTSKILRDN